MNEKSTSDLNLCRAIQRVHAESGLQYSDLRTQFGLSSATISKVLRAGKEGRPAARIRQNTLERFALAYGVEVDELIHLSRSAGEELGVATDLDDKTGVVGDHAEPLPYAPLSVRELVKLMADQIGVDSSIVSEKISEIILHAESAPSEKKQRTKYTQSATTNLKSVAEETPGTAFVTLPFHGQIAAGSPITTEDPDDTVLVYNGRNASRAHYLVRVAGSSMEPAIQDGDLIAIRSSVSYISGDVVAALVDGEVTLKRYEKHADGSEHLFSDNPDFDEVVPLEEATIQGIMVGLQRNTKT